MSVGILRGAEAIGHHLGISSGHAQNLHQQGHLPTFRLSGDNAPHATPGGLNQWRRLASSARLLGNLPADDRVRPVVGPASSPFDLTPDAKRKHACDARAAVEQADFLLAFLAAFFGDDPDTSPVGLALEGIGVILDKAKAELEPLAA